MVRRTLGMGMLLVVGACAGETDNPASTASELSAAKQYIGHKITKKPLRWKKTAHVFPDMFPGEVAVAPAQVASR